MSPVHPSPFPTSAELVDAPNRPLKPSTLNMRAVLMCQPAGCGVPYSDAGGTAKAVEPEAFLVSSDDDGDDDDANE